MAFLRQNVLRSFDFQVNIQFLATKLNGLMIVSEAWIAVCDLVTVPFEAAKSSVKNQFHLKVWVPICLPRASDYR